MSRHITPAALAALAKGDVENFITASTPGGIERQEAMGQATFVGTKNSLPIKGNHPAEYRTILEQAGCVFGEPIDDLFVSVRFPAGWTKRATDHSMWSELIDDKGRKRASIFYKAAFYDRDAFVNLECRYGVNTEYPKAATGNYVLRCVTAKDFATGAVLFDTGQTEQNRTSWEDPQRKAAEAWLTENKPGWENPANYWDESSETNLEVPNI